MFTTILFPTWEQHQAPRAARQPDCFKDLNLNQVFAPILRNPLCAGLEGFFYTPLSDSDAILFRQEIFRDLEDAELRDVLSSFSEALILLVQDFSSVREALTSKTTYENDYLSRGHVMECASKYCELIASLASELRRFSPASRGLRGFFEFFAEYASSAPVSELRERVGKLRSGFSEVRYCMHIKGETIKVRKYEQQPKQSDALAALFDRFKCDGIPNYRRHLPDDPAERKVEAAVLQLVAELYPELFSELNGFCGMYLNFMNDTIVRFSSEIRFYLSWLDYIRPISESGLPFCYPELSDSACDLYGSSIFDIALAAMIGAKTVPNDFSLSGDERILVITGPNQGGKTTFARSFGQAHWLASIGLSVPGHSARLLMFDKILCHFEKEEDLTNLSGKLQDDLIRLKALMDEGSPRSIFLINEIYTSTTAADALTLGSHMINAILKLGAPAIIVTFLDELACHGPETVSMVSAMKDNFSEERSFKIIRRPPDGQAHAIQIAARHSLTYEQIKRRISV